MGFNGWTVNGWTVNGWIVNGWTSLLIVRDATFWVQVACIILEMLPNGREIYKSAA